MSGRSAPDRWMVIEVARPEDDEILALVVEELLGFAGRGVEERTDSVLAYLPEPSATPDVILAEVAARIASVTGGETPELTFRWQCHEDWEEIWKQGFASRRVTDRIVVAPIWENRAPGPGEVVLSLEPGMAFGTAEHPTTRGSLRLLDDRVEAGERIADIGAGSGILAIAAALLGADRVIAVEMDTWSCAAARENVERNGVQDRVEVREGAVEPEFLPGEPPFDGIIANIESGILERLLPGFRSGLRDGGWLIVSGVLESESLELAAFARECGFALEVVDREGGWWTAAFRAGSPLNSPPRSASPLSR